MDPQALKQGLLFWLFLRGLKVSLGTVEWYRSSYGTDFDTPEIASPVKLLEDEASASQRLHAASRARRGGFHLNPGALNPGALHLARNDDIESVVPQLGCCSGT